MYGGLQSGTELGETVASVCSETRLILPADGIGVTEIRSQEVLQTPKAEDCLAVALPGVKAVDKVCYVCNIVVLTVVEACTVASALWKCVLWCLDVTSQ